MDELHEERDASEPPEAPEPEEPPSSAMQAVIRRFMRYLGEEGSGLTGIWMMCALFNLGMFAISAAIQYETGFVPFDFEAMQDPEAMRRLAQTGRDMNYLGLLNYPLAVIAASLYYAGMGSMRRLEEPSEAPLSFSELRSAMFSQFGSVAIAAVLYMVATFIGMMCCVLPGLIAAFLFMPAPYIASKPRFGATAGFTESIEWLKRHTSLFVVAALISVLSAAGLVAIQYVTTTVFVDRFGDTGFFIANGAIWLISVIVGYFSWMFIGSIYTTIDLAEERFSR